jgi:hypothetical protein
MLCAGATLFVLAGALGGILASREWEYREAQAESIVVVLQDGVSLRCGNGLSYAAKFATPVNRGVEARLLYTRGDWLQIELLTGEAGWVPRQAVVQ